MLFCVTISPRMKAEPRANLRQERDEIPALLEPQQLPLSLQPHSALPGAGAGAAAAEPP